MDELGNVFYIDLAFNKIFTQGLGIIVGSLVAFLLGQFLDVYIFQKLRQFTGAKLIWLRATGSTLISHLLRKQLVNELLLYVSPKLLGHLSKSFSGMLSITELNNKINFKVHDILPIKNDLKIRLVK